MASTWLLRVSRAISCGIEELPEALETTYNSVQTTASGLESNGWLTRLKHRLYLVVPLVTGEESQYTAQKFYIASHLVDPMYIDFWNALGFHGFTEQVPPSIYVTTTNLLSDRAVYDVEYHFVPLAERKFFGHEQYSVGGHSVPIASPRRRSLIMPTSRNTVAASERSPRAFVRTRRL
jgi:predicted transcriptional regulator of viral defense system